MILRSNHWAGRAICGFTPIEAHNSKAPLAEAAVVPVPGHRGSARPTTTDTNWPPFQLFGGI